MFGFAKYVTVLSASLLFGCAILAPGDAGKDGQLAESEDMLQEAAMDYETVILALASWGDYRSASQVALALAFARNRLWGTTPAVCAALSQSREYRRLMSTSMHDPDIEKADYRIWSGIHERTGGMARERALCD